MDFRTIRTKLKMTQQEMAAILKTSVATIHRTETLKTRPSPATLAMLAKFLNRRFILRRVISRREWHNYMDLRSKAQGRAYSAVKRGELPRLINTLRQKPVGISCSDCSELATQYDHRDYRKPLKVEPVCCGCNKRRGVAIYTFDWNDGKKGKK